MSPQTTGPFAEFFKAEVGGVFGYLLVRCGSRPVAEDLTAETFIAAARAVEKGPLEEVTPGWLRTVARRRLVDHWRAEARERRRVDLGTLVRGSGEAPAGDPDDLVDQALHSLNTRQRAALTLRYFDDYAVSEVAAALDISYKATESLLMRARRAFEVSYVELAGQSND